MSHPGSSQRRGDLFLVQNWTHKGLTQHERLKVPPAHRISQGLSTHLELSSQREQRQRHVMEERMRKRVITIDQRTGNARFAEHK